MYKKSFFLSFLFIVLVIIAVMGFVRSHHDSKLPVVAIANYGPHSSLEASIKGFKDEMAQAGFIDNKNIRYETADVGFDPALIPQMVTSLKQHNPKIMLVLTTPIAQFAKGKIKDIPLIYCDITDPVDAGLIKEKYKADANMTGSSEMQDLKGLLQFARILLPQAKRVGLLYATSESNDTVLVNRMRSAASDLNMTVVAIPVEQARDVPVRVQQFRDKVDFIYVGTSGPIQPTLPAIAAEAKKMQIPIFNADSQAVRNGMALASFGVDYQTVGRNAGKLAAALLKGQPINILTPVYPKASDHHAVINKKEAAEFNIKIPANVEAVE